jgi:hypothetical protein
VHVYSKPENAVAYLPDFEAWTAYDLAGRRLALTGGWHRSWRLGTAEVAVEHGRRLEPVDNESANPEALRALLGADVGERDQHAGLTLEELVAAWVDRNDWDD